MWFELHRASDSMDSLVFRLFNGDSDTSDEHGTGCTGLGGPIALLLSRPEGSPYSLLE